MLFYSIESKLLLSDVPHQTLTVDLCPLPVKNFGALIAYLHCTCRVLVHDVLYQMTWPPQYYHLNSV